MTAPPLRFDLSWSDRSGLEDAIRRHPLVRLAAPSLTPPELIGIARSLGEVVPARRLNFRLPGYTAITVFGNVRNAQGDVVAASALNNGFHSDMSYSPRAPAVTLLYAVRVPAHGGDTHFTSLYRLHEQLDEATRKTWSTLRIQHESNSSYYDGNPNRSCIRPLIQHHPDTGRPLLFVSPPYMTKVMDLEESQGWKILERACSLVEPPDYVHRWQVNDLLVWDNRAVVHRATEHDPDEARCLWRISVDLGA